MVNSTTVIQGRGSGGKRLKLMKPDESDNKSNIQTLSLTGKKCFPYTHYKKIK